MPPFTKDALAAARHVVPGGVAQEIEAVLLETEGHHSMLQDVNGEFAHGRRRGDTDEAEESLLD